MISWRVWLALQHPPDDHPLFQRTTASFRPTVTIPTIRADGELVPWARERSNSKRNPIWSSGWSILAIIIVIAICATGGLIVVPGVFCILPLVILLLITSGTFYGLNSAVRIGGAIAKERELNTFDLFSLTPPGAFGMSWIVSMGCLYRTNRFHQLRRWVTAISVALSILTVLLFTLALISNFRPSSNSQRAAQLYEIGAIGWPATAHDVSTAVNSLTLLAAFYLEFAQSLALAVLLAMLVATWTNRRFEAQLLTLVIFVGLQLVTYLGTLIIGFTIVPALGHSLNLRGWLWESASAITRLGIFWVIREAIVVGVWHYLADGLSATADELDTWSKVKRKRTLL